MVTRVVGSGALGRGWMCVLAEIGPPFEPRGYNRPKLYERRIGKGTGGGSKKGLKNL